MVAGQNANKIQQNKTKRMLCNKNKQSETPKMMNWLLKPNAE